MFVTSVAQQVPPMNHDDIIVMVVYIDHRIVSAIRWPRTLRVWGQELWAREFPRCFLFYVGVGLRVKAWTVEIVLSSAVDGGYGFGFSVTLRVKGPAFVDYFWYFVRKNLGYGVNTLGKRKQSSEQKPHE